MSRTMNKKIQSINRNLSVDRERVSNACLIGLYVCLGNAVTVKLPSKRAKNTLAHLSILSTQFEGKDINEVVQQQYQFPSILDKNKRRDKEVAIFNTISKAVIGNHYKLAKRTTAVKTLKLKIFKEIGFLNKNGVTAFGTKLTFNLMNRNPCGKCSQKAFVELNGFDEEIMQILKEVCEIKENINEFYLSEYSQMYKGIVKSEIDESSQMYQKDVFVKSEESWKQWNYLPRVDCYDRGVFRYVDSSCYQTELADWFY